MVFSSFTFLFIFLPIVLFSYYIIKNRTYRNIILFLFSLVFYAWGEPIYILLMLFSIIVNYFLVIKMDKARKENKKLFLIVDIIFNLLIIGFFKYGNFLLENINWILGTSIPNYNIALPIGISFYTFQILSYTIDVYRKKTNVQKNIIHLGTYISLFPQLIAGPIIRYETIEKQLVDRKETISGFVEGLKRFVLGLGKKVIIADSMAMIANNVYTGDLQNSGTLLLWMAAIAYSFQIYFDFSGYSDMAIGLSRMFGFHLEENFNYPYIAKSITDFWKRWHISLSTWFRDYVYIPLGGNRVRKVKWIRNIIIVWGLTGLWHGASWNFIIWGIYYAIILIIEKLLLSSKLEKMPKAIKQIYTWFLIIIGWVIFRIDNLTQMLQVLKNMFLWHPSDIMDGIILNFDIFSNIPYFLISMIAMFPILPWLKKKTEGKMSWYFLSNIAIIVIFLFSIVLLLQETYHPFIYFRF